MNQCYNNLQNNEIDDINYYYKLYDEILANLHNRKYNKYKKSPKFKRIHKNNRNKKQLKNI